MNCMCCNMRRVDNATDQVEAVNKLMGDQKKVTIQRNNESVVWLSSLRARARLELCMYHNISMLWQDNGDIVLEKMK